MRFSLSALFFVVAGFIFFILWSVGSLFLDEVYDALSPTAPSEALELMDLFISAFGIICAIFFVAAILLIFFLDSIADEPEMYWRR